MRGPQKAQRFVGPLDGRVSRLLKNLEVFPTIEITSATRDDDARQ
jgi:hypothetical protein